MINGNDKMVNEARQFVTGLLENHLQKGFHYHNLQHTMEVLQNAEVIGNYAGIDPGDFTLLRLSALFHDVGYVDCYQGHEEAGVSYASEFMLGQGAGKKDVERVTRAIMATRVPQTPHDDMSGMLCDADLFYLSSRKEYFPQAERLRREWDHMGVRSMDEMEFHANSLKFFSAHHYHSKYGKLFLQPGKEKVAELIREKLSGRTSESNM